MGDILRDLDPSSFDADPRWWKLKLVLGGDSLVSI
jgi:hypothetical protein